MLRRFRTIVVSLFVASCAIAPALLLAAPVHAADNDIVVSIHPSEQEIELIPGERFSGSVTVYNVGQSAFNFEVDIAPYQVKVDKTDQNKHDPDFITQNAYTKLTNWISLPQKYFHLEPGHAATVDFHIDVPEDVLGGGQYAALIIRTTDRSADAETDATDAIDPENPPLDTESSKPEGTQIIAQLASILYAHVAGGEMRVDGALVKHDFPGLVFGGELKISSVFENGGNVDFRVTESWTICDFFTGNEVVTPASATSGGLPVGTTSATVLPGTKRTIDMVWKDSPQIGVFRVTQTISFLEDMQTYSRIVIICPLWLALLLVIFVILIILWIISIIARHKRNQPQVF